MIPTYNEAKNLPSLGEALFGLGFPNLSILIIDDNSPDGTAETARKLGEAHDGRVEVICRPGKMGLGTAYVAGFARVLKTGARYVVQMDADLSHPPGQIPAMLAKLETADVVVGSRYVNGVGADERTTLGRKFLSAWANGAIRLVTGLKPRDITSGFKAFRREALEALDLSSFKSSGYGFQAEVAHACQRKGMRVVEHPIVFSNRAYGTSKMSWGIVGEAIQHLLFLRWKND